MKRLDTLILEEQDFTGEIKCNQLRGFHVELVLVPEKCLEEYNKLFASQMQSNISIGGIYFGKVVTYKDYG